MSMTTTARVWLQIAAGGGLWRPSEVREALPGEPAKTIDKALDSLVDQHALVLHHADETYKFQRYSVTKDCLIPRGLTVEEVMTALALEAKC